MHETRQNEASDLGTFWPAFIVIAGVLTIFLITKPIVSASLDAFRFDREDWIDWLIAVKLTAMTVAAAIGGLARVNRTTVLEGTIEPALPQAATREVIDAEFEEIPSPTPRPTTALALRTDDRPDPRYERAWAAYRRTEEQAQPPHVNIYA